MSKEEIEYGYKVVTPTGGSLTGAWVDTTADAVFYSTHRWTQPKSHCGPLAVFGTLSQAKSFYGLHQKIYKCKFVRSSSIMLYRRTIHVRRALDTCPWGTIFARKVKLIKLMDDDFRW